MYLALLDFRNTPTQGMDTSPAQRLMSCRTKTLLPTSGTLLQPQLCTKTEEQLSANKERMSFYYNRHTKNLPPLQSGDTVRIQPTRLGEKELPKTEVINKPNIRSYDVRTELIQF